VHQLQWFAAEVINKKRNEIRELILTLASKTTGKMDIAKKNKETDESGSGSEDMVMD